MASKIDTLISALGDFNKTLGEFSSDIKTLYRRAAEDRDERRREHSENQERMGEIAQSAAASIAELRPTATQRWDETGQAVERLSDETKELTRARSTISPASSMSMPPRYRSNKRASAAYSWAAASCYFSPRSECLR